MTSVDNKNIYFLFTCHLVRTRKVQLTAILLEGKLVRVAQSPLCSNLVVPRIIGALDGACLMSHQPLSHATICALCLAMPEFSPIVRLC